MIIYGSTSRTFEIGDGEFECPACGSVEEYVHYRVGRYFTLYFIPLFQVYSQGEHVTCRSCNRDFKTDVLTMSKRDRAVAKVQRDLEDGMALETAVKRLVKQGLAQDVAQRVVDDAAGEDLKTCPACQITFIDDLDECSSCGEKLE